MKMRICIAATLLALVSVAGFAQRLPTTGPAAVLDGAVAAGEYALEVALDRATLHASRTADTLYMALEAQTSGWVAIGVGSAKMDAAWIYIGYVDRGQAVFAAERGSGHGHKAAAEAPKVDHRLGERGDRTTLELAFRSADLIGAGQTELACIVAYGRRDNLGSYHAFRRTVRIQLQ